MPRHQWTEEEDARLLAMRRKGLPRWQIAFAFDMTERAVADRLRRVDPELRPWTTQDELQLMQRAADGATFPQIAVEMSRSLDAVRSRWSVLMGLSPQQQKGRAARGSETRYVPEDTQAACQKHLDAILAANPNGFMAWSEKRVGVRGVAPCAPVFYPLKRAA